MAGAKKNIHDNHNVILGNCELIIDKFKHTIEVNRKGEKSYFEGPVEDCVWRVLRVEGMGNYWIFILFLYCKLYMVQDDEERDEQQRWI